MTKNEEPDHVGRIDYFDRSPFLSSDHVEEAIQSDIAKARDLDAARDGDRPCVGGNESRIDGDRDVDRIVRERAKTTRVREAEARASNTSSRKTYRDSKSKRRKAVKEKVYNLKAGSKEDIIAQFMTILQSEVEAAIRAATKKQPKRMKKD